MRIGVIGSSQVGQTLAAGFASKGHLVVIGARDPAASLAKTDAKPGAQPLAAWARANPKVKVGTFAQAAQHGEVLVLCVNGPHVAEAIQMARPENLAGKLVLETSNPLEFKPTGVYRHHAVPDSGLQMAQRAAPAANFVKAWNCTPAPLMVDPAQGPGDQLLCGDDGPAKAKAAAILKEFGWRCVDIGGSDKAPYIEATMLAFCNYAAATGDWGWILRLAGRKTG
jgi:predicted dinucleotide-binding enzyme